MTTYNRFEVTMWQGEVDPKNRSQVKVATLDEADTIVNLFMDKRNPSNDDAVTIYMGGLLVRWFVFGGGCWQRKA